MLLLGRGGTDTEGAETSGLVKEGRPGPEKEEIVTPGTEKEGRPIEGPEIMSVIETESVAKVTVLMSVNVRMSPSSVKVPGETTGSVGLSVPELVAWGRSGMSETMLPEPPAFGQKVSCGGVLEQIRR